MAAMEYTAQRGAGQVQRAGGLVHLSRLYVAMVGKDVASRLSAPGVRTQIVGAEL